jgi:hypothetical protein
LTYVEVFGGPAAARERINAAVLQYVTGYPGDPRADTVYPDQNYGYLYVMRVSPIQNSVYSVIYSKKFIGRANNLVQDMKNWFVQDLKSNQSVSSGIAKIKVDASWIELPGRK